jgi:hypothetical protein
VTPIIDVKDVTRTFGSGPNATARCGGVTMTVGEGQLDSVLHLTDGAIRQES